MSIVKDVSKAVVYFSSFLEIIIFKRFIPNFTPAAVWLWGVPLFTGTVAGIWICCTAFSGLHQKWTGDFYLSIALTAIGIGYLVFIPRILALPTLMLKLFYALFVIIISSAIVIATIYIIVTIFIIAMVILFIIALVLGMASRRRVYIVE